MSEASKTPEVEQVLNSIAEHDDIIFARLVDLARSLELRLTEACARIAATKGRK